MSNLSNIELYHNNLKLSGIVEDDTILEHCTIQYKYYVDKQLPRNAKGWRVYNLRCKYCAKAIRSVELFVKHIKICPALEDNYVPKPKRLI